ncbi:hypothetical protein BAE44_0015799 [Dichanthelium oligosanthes]|uniref:Uncharacterized protein n=1 Tax=Dichanthelium oligosanthes TaxID=888268 RepID=A0A1E5VDG0_9POAL|nr:hypothetical protein BAE44_0015799 [Dichanthelium oligosanthes]
MTCCGVDGSLECSFILFSKSYSSCIMLWLHYIYIYTSMFNDELPEVTLYSFEMLIT